LIKSATFYKNRPNLMRNFTKNLELYIDRYYS